MNAYQGGRTSQGKIIPINRHVASLIFGILCTNQQAYHKNNTRDFDVSTKAEQRSGKIKNGWLKDL